MKQQLRFALCSLASLLALTLPVPAFAQTPSKGGSKPTTRTAARPNVRPNAAPAKPAAPAPLRLQLQSLPKATACWKRAPTRVRARPSQLHQATQSCCAIN